MYLFNFVIFSFCIPKGMELNTQSPSPSFSLPTVFLIFDPLKEFRIRKFDGITFNSGCLLDFILLHTKPANLINFIALDKG